MDTYDGSIEWKHVLPLDTQAIRIFDGEVEGTFEYQYKVSGADGELVTMVQTVNSKDGVSKELPRATGFKGDSLVYNIPQSNSQNSRIEIDLEKNQVKSTSEKQVYGIKVNNSGAFGYGVN